MFQMKKLLIAGALALASVVAVAGCGGNQAATSSGSGASGEKGRIYGQKGSFEGRYNGQADVSKVDTNKWQLPKGMDAGGHGGAHGYLSDDFITAILTNRQPRVNVATALNTTVSGVYAHMSAMKDGETLKIPQFAL